jgi:Fe-S cluster assembly ATP-binding protein
MNKKISLLIENLTVAVDKKVIIDGLSLSIKEGELHAIMGANGSGKSTLAMAVMGHPRYKITKGKIYFKGELINDLSPDQRARLGIFLSMQHPQEISGVKFSTMLYQSAKALKKENQANPLQFRQELLKHAAALNIPESFMDRNLNEGFSGGEKKKSEMVQMNILKPSFAIIDEVDSGLDSDSLKIIAKNIESMRKVPFAGLIITHYNKILSYIKPDFIHVMLKGRIVKTGKGEIINQIEEKGYQSFLKDNEKTRTNSN